MQYNHHFRYFLATILYGEIKIWKKGLQFMLASLCRP